MESLRRHSTKRSKELLFGDDILNDDGEVVGQKDLDPSLIGRLAVRNTQLAVSSTGVLDVMWMLYDRDTQRTTHRLLCLYYIAQNRHDLAAIHEGWTYDTHGAPIKPFSSLTVEQVGRAASVFDMLQDLNGIPEQ